ncbi:hypothetical protein [Streptomyces tendae]|uniref:hypothetical protein n=1 Tax=Streptomyces tendae TaxID=1932 RepID=UPI00133114C1|nr:hypothetical protein [Streptomyces tendae]
MTSDRSASPSGVRLSRVVPLTVSAPLAWAPCAPPQGRRRDRGAAGAAATTYFVVRRRNVGSPATGPAANA